MNQKVVERINQLKVEKAEFNSALAQAKLNEDFADEKEDLEKEIAAIDADIAELGTHLSDEDYVVEESEVVELDEEDCGEIEDAVYDDEEEYSEEE